MGGVVIAIGPVAAIVMTPLALVPSGPFRLDRIGVLAVSAAFAWCGWYLLRNATPGTSWGPGSDTERVGTPGPGCGAVLR